MPENIDELLLNWLKENNKEIYNSPAKREAFIFFYKCFTMLDNKTNHNNL